MYLSSPRRHGFMLRRKFSRLRASFDRLTANPKATARDLFLWAASYGLRLSITTNDVKVVPR